MNPFAQSETYTRVKFILPREAAPMAENAFDDLTISVSSFEDEADPSRWTFELLCEEQPDLQEIHQRLMLLASIHHFPLPPIASETVPQEDWVSAVSRNFPPIRTGSFFVHGSHYKNALPPGCTKLLVDAGAAFGSGEHATTSSCLLAFEWLSKHRAFARVLDMGCGSGILAMAAAKRLKCECRAVDIDEVAVKVTRENIRRNRVHPFMQARTSDGYASRFVQDGAPYDLVFSNILARPLVKFAPQLTRALAPGGMAILSGLLVTQEPFVAHAHRQQGLRFVRRFRRGEWSTLVMRKPDLS